MIPYSLVRAIFREYVLQPATLVRDFGMSDDRRYTEQAPGSVDYPVLQIDTPSFEVNLATPAAHGTSVVNTSVALLDTASVDDWAMQEATLSLLLVEAHDLISFLARCKNRFGKKARVEVGEVFPIKGYGPDHAWGWGFSFTLTVPDSLHCTPIGDRQIAHLAIAKWLDGQDNTLSIEVLGDPYTAPWTEKHLLPRALRTLAAAITDDRPVTATVSTELELIIVGDTHENFTYSVDPLQWRVIADNRAQT